MSASKMMVSDEEKRWVVVGIAMNKVVAPVLRDVIKAGMDTHYDDLDKQLTPSCTLKTLTYPSANNDPHLKTLKFQNINNNSVLHGNVKRNYSFTINSSVDLAKIYLPNHLAMFYAFDESLDMTAILNLLGISYYQPKAIFSALTQTSADDVRKNVRNKWGHFDVSEWSDTFFDDCFAKLEALVRSLGLTAGKEKKTLEDLHDWQNKGCQLCMGHAVDGDLLTLVQKNVNDLIDDSNNIKSSLDQQIKQFASVQKQVAVLEVSQLCHGTRLDEHDEALMQQQEKLQEVEETLKILLRYQKAVSERLSMQIQALQEGLAKTDDKVEQLEQGLAAVTDKVEHKVGQLEQGLTALTDKVEHEVELLEQGLTAVTDKVEHKVEQLEQCLSARTDKVEHKVELLKQGLAAKTDKVEHLDQGAESLKMKDVKPEVDAYSATLKASIKRRTELQPKLFDIPTVAKMKTDEIFTNLVMQHGRKPIKDGDAERRAHLTQYGQVSGTRVKHCQELFICTSEEKEDPKSILVTGKAGIGKTLFCQKLYRDWANDKLFLSPTNTEMPSFKFVYLLTFRQLNLLEKETLTLKEILNCSSILDGQSDINDSLFEYIVKHPEEVLIILDGFDEFSQQAYISGDAHERYPNSCREKMPVAALCAKLMRGNLLGKAVVMVTSRPDESDKIHGMDFDRKVEITGFSPPEVREYIEKYFRENEIMKNTVLEHVTKNENLISFAHIPVFCALMCSYMEYVLKQSKSTEDLPISASDLYFEVFNIFKEKHNKNEVPHFHESFLDKLSKFAAELLMEKKFLFGEEEMKKFSSKEVESLRKSGILHCGPPFRVSFSQTKKQFCFTHLTLQEYLAARWFVKKKEIPPEETVSTMVMQFIAGILSKVKDEKLMEKLLEQLSPNASQKNRHLLQAKCLYEYQDKEFAKDHYRQHPVRDEEVCFIDITDVDCIAISFFVDSINALNEEEPSTRHQTLSSGQPPFITVNSGMADSELILPEQWSSTPIKRLIFKYSMISSGLRRICASLERDSCSITELSLERCQLNNECVDFIRGPLSKTLTSLLLIDNEITDVDVASLCEALKQPSCKVTTLHLRVRNRITDVGVASLCEALKQPRCKVTTLHLVGNCITPVGVASLCETLKQQSCKVTKLDLGGNRITDAGVASLCETLTQPSCKVTKLDLGGNQITPVGVASLCEALKEPGCKVTKLDLPSNLVLDVGVATLYEALKHSSCKVTKLDLRNNRITDVGVASLCEALKQPNCKVTKLHLAVNQITDVGVASLCEALKQPSCKVTKLGLGHNQITDVGVASLCEALTQKRCKVTTLYLYYNQITDVGVASLCEALKQPSCKVTKLDLGGNQITDVGVASLCEALKQPSCKVTKLDLGLNQITHVGVAILREALKRSSCKVNFKVMQTISP